MTDQHPHEGQESGPTQNVSDQTVEQLSSATVYDADGNKVGAVGQLYLGDNSGKPSWVTVKSGFFGMRESVVPMSGAQVNGDEIHVPYTKDHIKAAPHVDADGHLSPEEEQQLHRHYGLESGRSGGSDGESEDARRHEGDLEHHPHGHGGHRHGQDIEADQEVSGQAHREHHEHHDKYAAEAPAMLRTMAWRAMTPCATRTEPTGQGAATARRLLRHTPVTMRTPSPVPSPPATPRRRMTTAPVTRARLGCRAAESATWTRSSTAATASARPHRSTTAPSRSATRSGRGATRCPSARTPKTKANENRTCGSSTSRRHTTPATTQLTDPPHLTTRKVPLMSDAQQSVLAYAPHADKAVLDKMASTYRLVLANRDSALVSASDPEELKTVRENFLKKKLGLTQSDAELDKAIKEVMDQMKDGKANPRLAVYYLLAEKFNKLDVFKG